MANYGKKRNDEEFLSLAATSVILPGARVQGRRLVPDRGYRLEQGPDKNTIILLDNNGNDVGGVSCECGLQGGGCATAIINPGEIDEYAVCIPEEGCGTSGLFCFMGFTPAGGQFTLKFKM
jgi:hypothetical protein